jgi:N-acyl-D-aspartate/D-glutamate deacylase
MGDGAVGETATPEQIGDMSRLVHVSVEAGALGFSTSRGQAHVDHRGDPVPSRHASVAETLALCRAAGQHVGTSIETIPTIDQVFDGEAQMLLVAMSLAAGRPVNWNSLGLEQDPVARASRLAPAAAAEAAGGKVVALAPCEPVFTRYTLELPFLWESIPNWAATMRLPVAERIGAFGDPAVRDHLAAGAATINRKWVRWPDFTINDTEADSLRPLVGRTVGEIEAERGRRPFDVFCDIAVEGELRVGWATPVVGADDRGWRDLVELLRDPRVVAGASDAGAHLDIISAFAMYTGFLGGAVRERGLLPVEEAVAMLTGRPAALYGLIDRGTLEPGKAADVVIFDPDTIGHGPVEIRSDLPAGARRLFCEPHGIAEVLVNGVRTVSDGRLTGASAGRTIRSGRDTVTPALTP